MYLTIKLFKWINIKPQRTGAYDCNSRTIDIFVHVLLGNENIKDGMADIHSKETRSYNMSRIRAKDTKPELLVRRFIFANGFRYKLHDKSLPGKPDLVFPKYKTVVFVHGCFWHGHGDCKYFVIPKTRTEWWMGKINKNKDKDSIVVASLKKMGWKVITVWECELAPSKREVTLNSIIKQLIGND